MIYGDYVKNTGKFMIARFIANNFRKISTSENVF